jgi:Leucine-rich repeat (LRR) protein
MKFEKKFLLLQLIIVLCVIQTMLAEKNRCNPSLCDCSRYIEDEYRYQNVISCPQNKSIVRFEVMNYTSEDYISRLGHPFIKTFIYCDTKDQLVFDVISQTNVEYFDSVQYIKCPVPLNSSLGDGMPILEELDFGHDGESVFNDWKAIHFSGLKNLVNLDLETETLDQLPNDTFAELPKLKSVIIEMKHPNLHLFSSAKIFQIGGVDGDNFNTNAFRNSSLESVNIFSSKFNPLTNSALEGLAGLKKLMFAGNKLISFDPDFLNALVNLEDITFMQNNIGSFTNGLFSKNKKLNRIFIQFESIKTLPNKIFGDLSELKEVAVSYCELEVIPDDIFKNSENIEIIYFDSNKLTSLPVGLFDNLFKLNKIILLRNDFKSIAAANIKVVSKSLYIDFSQNQIEDIAIEDLGIFEKNTTVHLGFNKISKFSGIVYLRQHIERYNSTVLLRENPFDCSTCDVYHVVQERAPEYDDPDDFVTKPFSIDTFALKCTQPAEFESESVRHLNLTNYDCNLNK